MLRERNAENPPVYDKSENLLYINLIKVVSSLPAAVVGVVMSKEDVI